MVVALFHSATWPVVGVPEFDTFPPPAGVAQVPSPRQKVELDAEVPPFSRAIGRFPVTPLANGSPVQLTRLPAVGVPRLGVTSVGLVAFT